MAPEAFPRATHAAAIAPLLDHYQRVLGLADWDIRFDPTPPSEGSRAEVDGWAVIHVLEGALTGDAHLEWGEGAPDWTRPWQVAVSAHQNSRYCSRTCAIRFSSKRGPRLLHHRSQDVVKRLRPAILARDGWQCYLCGGAIAKGLTFPHALSLTIDHVIPLSAGGTNEIENLRPAHLSCNVAKSDRLPTWWERASA